jgi:MFS family permease
MSVTAISVMMGLWYATRVIAPSTWTSLAAASPRPIRLLRVGCVLTLISFAAFLLPLPQPWMYPAMVVFCFFYNAVMPQFESITLTHLGNDSHRYGLIRVWGSLGFIAIVTLFGWLIEGDGTASRAGLLPWMMLPLFVAAGRLGLQQPLRARHRQDRRRRQRLLADRAPPAGAGVLPGRLHGAAVVRPVLHLLLGLHGPSRLPHLHAGPVVDHRRGLRSGRVLHHRPLLPPL